MGWGRGDLFYEQPQPAGATGFFELSPANTTGRQSFRDLVLPARFRSAVRKLNPLLPDEALQQAELALTGDRSAMLPVVANRDVYRLLRDGIPVEVRQRDGSLKRER